MDSSLIEAAQIDGANIFQRILYVTIPSIKPTIITMSLLAIGKIFKGSLDLFYQLIGNNGALFDATDVIDTYVFRSLITDGDVGKTAAVGLYQSVLCFVTIMVVNGNYKKNRTGLRSVLERKNYDAYMEKNVYRRKDLPGSWIHTDYWLCNSLPNPVSNYYCLFLFK